MLTYKIDPFPGNIVQNRKKARILSTLPATQ